MTMNDGSIDDVGSGRDADGGQAVKASQSDFVSKADSLVVGHGDCFSRVPDRWQDKICPMPDPLFLNVKLAISELVYQEGGTHVAKGRTLCSLAHF